MAMSKAEYLPQEIIIDILSRLPAKVIGQFRCVSKQWLNFLSDPQFIKFHHTIHSHKEESKLIFVSSSGALHTITFNQNPQNGTIDAIPRKLNFRMGLWRRHGQLPVDHGVPIGGSGILVNGALHWLARKSPDYSSVIVAFYLCDEKFLELPVPNALDNNNFVLCDLVAFRGCLCMLLNDTEENKIEFWMMKEYGLEESWTKFRIAGLDLVHGLVPFCSISDDDVVLNVDREKLIVYNMKEDQWSDMKVGGITAKFERTRSFMESLVSPVLGKGT
ncbi:PREDICTED: F-box/kelch-repeat protein At3g06240-like [Nicotiana attenuata]|uniref:F-boxkelch-repeat protein n=1 Tax=Nicotiana attenuata TaxID=49451 RepID=A0A1J6HYH0_NICAT|nr:PREDICTED: F-box/kelch-repeat protein At3g06240-like [Nicotiana attenuata]OIS97377.1 f-boxkelch-repeat protein [Nicotiana attenuata]